MKHSIDAAKYFRRDVMVFANTGGRNGSLLLYASMRLEFHN